MSIQNLNDVWLMERVLNIYCTMYMVHFGVTKIERYLQYFPLSYIFKGIGIGVMEAGAAGA